MARLKLKHGSRTVVNTRPGRGFRKKPTRLGNGVFLPDHEQQVRLIAMKGASDDEIADMFGVSHAAFAAWRRNYPSFEKSLTAGRLHADADVVLSAYKLATGFEHEEDVVTAKGGVVRIQRYYKPEVGAVQYWLNNRQPDNWCNKSAVTGGRKNGEDLPIGIKAETRNEIIESILVLVASKPDGSSKPVDKKEA